MRASSTSRQVLYDADGTKFRTREESATFAALRAALPHSPEEEDDSRLVALRLRHPAPPSGRDLSEAAYFGGRTAFEAIMRVWPKFDAFEPILSDLASKPGMLMDLLITVLRAAERTPTPRLQTIALSCLPLFWNLNLFDDEMARGHLVAFVERAGEEAAQELQRRFQGQLSWEAQLAQAEWDAEGKEEEEEEEEESEESEDQEEDDEDAEAETLGTSVIAASLPTDLAALVCTFLPTASLLSLRRVSHHWAAASRLPRSWVSSHHEFRSTPEFESRLASLPHLRSVTLPNGLTPRTDDRALRLAPHLHLVERLSLPSLPSATDFSAPILTLLAAMPRLTTLDTTNAWVLVAKRAQKRCMDALGAIGLNHLTLGFIRWEEPIMDQLSRTPMAARLVSLRLIEERDFDDSILRPSGELLARFSSLEVLDIIHDANIDVLAEDMRAFTHLPNLRVFSYSANNYHSVFNSNHVNALLSSPEWNGRLEYLRLDSVEFGRTSLDRIANECTTLIGLDIHISSIAGEMQVTEGAWCSLDQPTPESRRSLHLTTFLATSQAFRRRLVHLTIACRFGMGGDMARSCRQVWRRFPRLALLQIGSGTQQQRRETRPEEDPWLPCETLDDSATITHEEPRHPPLLYDARRPLFSWVRALKMHCGLPLSPAEAAAQPLPL